MKKNFYLPLLVTCFSFSVHAEKSDPQALQWFNDTVSVAPRGRSGSLSGKLQLNGRMDNGKPCVVLLGNYHFDNGQLFVLDITGADEYIVTKGHGVYAGKTTDTISVQIDQPFNPEEKTFHEIQSSSNKLVFIESFQTPSLLAPRDPLNRKYIPTIATFKIVLSTQEKILKVFASNKIETAATATEISCTINK